MAEEKRGSVHLPPAPERRRRGTDVLSGPDVAHVLKVLNVSVEQFCNLTGANPMRVEEHLSGIGDENMPFYYQTALFGLHYCPELRTASVPLEPEMPFLPPPKRPVSVRGNRFRVKSAITGDMILAGLAVLEVQPSRFRQLCGMDQSRFKKIAKGKSDGDLLMFVELVLYVLYRCPWIRDWHPHTNSPSPDDPPGMHRVIDNPPLGLPLKAWGFEPPPPVYRLVPTRAPGRDA